jgi:hypothetical protein
MVTSDPTTAVNVVICVVIVGALMFYRKKGARHRPLVSWLAYLAILAYANVPFRYLCGLYRESNLLVVAVNLIICAVVLRSRGNLARLIHALRL